MNIESLLADASASLDQKRFSDAISLSNQVLAVNPRSTPALRIAGYALLGLGNSVEAREYFYRSVDCDRYKLRALRAVADSFQLGGQPDQAKEINRQICEMAEAGCKSRQDYHAWIEAALALNWKESAKQAIETAITAHSDDAKFTLRWVRMGARAGICSQVVVQQLEKFQELLGDELYDVKAEILHCEVSRFRDASASSSNGLYSSLIKKVREVIQFKPAWVHGYRSGWRLCGITEAEQNTHSAEQTPEKSLSRDLALVAIENVSNWGRENAGIELFKILLRQGQPQMAKRAFDRWFSDAQQSRSLRLAAAQINHQLRKPTSYVPSISDSLKANLFYAELLYAQHKREAARNVFHRLGAAAEKDTDCAKMFARLSFELGDFRTTKRLVGRFLAKGESWASELNEKLEYYPLLQQNNAKTFKKRLLILRSSEPVSANKLRRSLEGWKISLVEPEFPGGKLAAPSRFFKHGLACIMPYHFNLDEELLERVGYGLSSSTGFLRVETRQINPESMPNEHSSSLFLRAPDLLSLEAASLSELYQGVFERFTGRRLLPQ